MSHGLLGFHVASFSAVINFHPLCTFLRLEVPNVCWGFASDFTILWRHFSCFQGNLRVTQAMPLLMSFTTAWNILTVPAPLPSYCLFSSGRNSYNVIGWWEEFALVQTSYSMLYSSGLFASGLYLLTSVGCFASLHWIMKRLPLRMVNRYVHTTCTHTPSSLSSALLSLPLLTNKCQARNPKLGEAVLQLLLWEKDRDKETDRVRESKEKREKGKEIDRCRQTEMYTQW